MNYAVYAHFFKSFFKIRFFAYITFDKNNFFSEILEPTNLLKDIEKKGIIEIDDSDDLTKQLNDLNELYKSGVLTKDEFKKAKNKILN